METYIENLDWDTDLRYVKLDEEWHKKHNGSSNSITHSAIIPQHIP